MPKGKRNLVSLARSLAALAPEDSRMVSAFAKELRGQKHGGGEKRAPAAPRKAWKARKKKEAEEVEADE